MDSFPKDLLSRRRSEETGDLVAENEFLLNELQVAYRQMEALLVESKEEADVTYKELQEKNRRLEKQLNELQKAHQELKEAQSQLVHSQRLAAMGQLAASIVHEIKNPLTVIHSNIDFLLMAREHNDFELRRLNPVLQASKRLKELVENILSFSRKQVAKISPTDINSVLEDLLSFLGKVKDKNIRTETAFDENIPKVYVDPNQIQQVFMNLIMNGFDAMPKGGLLSITTKAVERALIFNPTNRGLKYALPLDDWEELSKEVGHFICVEISDSGGGIPKEKLRNIFEPFFTTKEEGKGTGLGLTICRSIIENYEGNIAVSSKIGEGSTFSVFLPIRSEPLNR